MRQEALDSYIHQLHRSRRMGSSLGTRQQRPAPVAPATALAKRPGVALQENASRLLRDVQARTERQRERASLREEVEAEGGYYFSDEDDDD